jgi:F-type H+-transporting ATPase subunit delta
MPTDPVARVYAQSLLDLARARGDIDAIGAELEQVAQAIAAAPDLRAFVTAPVLDAAPKKRALEEALHGRVEDLLVDFLCLLIDKDRIGSLGDIAAAYRDLADVAAGRARVRAATAVPLPVDLRRRLEETLSAVLARDCVVEAEVEPELLGGLVLQVGDKLYDGSVRSHLRRVRNAMMRSSGYENQC